MAIPEPLIPDPFARLWARRKAKRPEDHGGSERVRNDATAKYQRTRADEGKNRTMSRSDKV